MQNVELWKYNNNNNNNKIENFNRNYSLFFMNYSLNIGVYGTTELHNSCD